MSKWALVLLLLVSCKAADEKYSPTENDKLKLQLKAKDIQMAQLIYQQTIQEYYKECTAIRNNHGWPDTVTCKMEDSTFFDSAKKEPKK